MNLKYTIKLVVFVLLGFCSSNSFGQDEVIVTDSTSIQPENQVEMAEKQVQGKQRKKVDGIAAVVGSYIILDSDVDLMYKDMQSQGISTAEITDCKLAGSLMENKLYAHMATQDSILVSDAEVNGMIDQQIEGFVAEAGSMEKLLEFYNKESEAALRDELFKINKQRQLANRMQQQIIDNIEVTPEEVRSFYISMDDKPIFGDEVELAQIVIKPKIPEAEKQKVIDRLNGFRADVLENDASFATKAVLYSDDEVSGRDGGRISLSRKDDFVKEFKDVAFSLQEGEISEPFETEFGYHIIQIDKIRGQTIDLRHILLIPSVTNAAVEKAKTKIDSIRTQIINDSISFADAAKKFSDEEQTSSEGGKLINPRTGDTRFELTKIDPSLYSKVEDLEEGKISLATSEKDRIGRPYFMIIKVNKRFAEHEANYATDYLKIKDLALRDKQLKEIEKWQKEKIMDTYIKVNGKYRDCEYTSNWLKSTE